MKTRFTRTYVNAPRDLIQHAEDTFSQNDAIEIIMKALVEKTGRGIAETRTIWEEVKAVAKDNCPGYIDDADVLHYDWLARDFYFSEK